MSNIINFIKDKSYYFLGGTVIIIIFVIVINSCSSNFSSGSYASIENKMVDAAKKYYAKKSDLLPKLDGGTVKVTISSLVESELLKEVYDIKDKSKKCSGYVEVTNVENEYSYVPFLTCEGNYEPKYLSDVVKSSKQDEYGNGVYNINNEYIYRGEYVNNYVMFDGKLWRIIKVDGNGNTKIILNDRLKDYYAFDDSYNPDKDDKIGIITDYFQTDMRKTLQEYYENNISTDNKAKVVATTLCVGSYALTDEFSAEKECSVVRENEKIGLLTANDYHMATLSGECKTLDNKICVNYNYLANAASTWILNSVSGTTYKNYYLDNTLIETSAYVERKVQPVIYITSKAIVTEGDGTEEKPYVIK